MGLSILRQLARRCTLASRITRCELVAWEDLGTEAVRKLEVVDFPLTVVIDREGTNLYDMAARDYQE